MSNPVFTGPYTWARVPQGRRLHRWGWDATHRAHTACRRYRMAHRDLMPAWELPRILDTVPPCPACLRAKQREATL